MSLNSRFTNRSNESLFFSTVFFLSLFFFTICLFDFGWNFVWKSVGIRLDIPMSAPIHISNVSIDVSYKRKIKNKEINSYIQLCFCLFFRCGGRGEALVRIRFLSHVFFLSIFPSASISVQFRNIFLRSSGHSETLVGGQIVMEQEVVTTTKKKGEWKKWEGRIKKAKKKKTKRDWQLGR